jgi:predicted exporter
VSGAVLAGGTLLIVAGPNPGAETVAGVRFDPELGNLRSVRARAIPLRARVAERFNVALTDISVLVYAPTEAAAFATQETVPARVQPFIERGELKRNGGVLDLIPSEKKQLETIHALQIFDVESAMKRFQSAAEKRFGERGALYFKPFLRTLRHFNLILHEPHPLKLAEILDGPLANVLAPYAWLADSPADYPVRLRSSWLPREANMPAAWYESLARALEDNPPGGALIQIAAPKMVGFELKESTLHDCGWITLAVSGCVLLLLIVSLRSVKLCVLALIPLVYSNLAMLAGVPLSQWLGWDYTLNFVNLIMFPLLLGSAVDYGVYMVFVMKQSPAPSLADLMAHTGRPVLYCIATTLIGFGSFVASSYTGLRSLGVASLWGYAGATFGALYVLPAVLGVLFPVPLQEGES